MTIYGNECPGEFDLIKNILGQGSTIHGRYTSPVNVTETYLGEPYSAFVNSPFLHEGRQVQHIHLFQGNGSYITYVWGMPSRGLGSFVAGNTESDPWRYNFFDGYYNRNETIYPVIYRYRYEFS